MASTAKLKAFEQAIAVTPVDSHTYSANLRDEWCIGTVPHGGYTTAVLYRLATTHFQHTHPTLSASPPTPISMQLSFLRRTAAGPAVLTVQDMKLGARTSTIHVALSQPREKKPPRGNAATEELEIKVAGYITVSPATAEVGISAPTAWSLHPPAPAGSGANGRVNLSALETKSRDGVWTRIEPPFPKFRRAAQQLELYGPDPASFPPGTRPSGVVDQWARFRPGGDTSARWTNESVAYLVDMFPMVLDGLDSMSSSVTTAAAQSDGENPPPAKFWYPTVTLNVDMKKRLPPEGVEWLYSRVQTKVVRDGRTDLDVVILDQDGEVVALSTQVGLVVSASRNIGKRSLIGKEKL